MNESRPHVRYLAPLRRWWPIVLGALVAGAIAAYVTLPGTPQAGPDGGPADQDMTYRATQILVLDAQSGDAPSFELVVLLAGQGDLTNRVVERMDGAVSAPDVDAVVLEANEDIGTLSITAVQPDPDLAEDLTRTYVAELNALLGERSQVSLEEDLARSDERLAELGERLASLEEEIEPLPEGDIDRRVLEAELDQVIEQHALEQGESRNLQARLRDLGRSLETLQEPTAVSTLVDPSLADDGFSVPQAPVTRFGIAMAMALFLGLALVFVIDYLDTRIRTRQDAEDAFGLPVIVEFPERSRRNLRNHPLPVRSDPGGTVAEAFRSLRLSVLLAPTWRLSGQSPTSNGSVGSVAPIRDHGAPRTLLVTSAISGEGKTTVVANLAASFAESGQRVLVVDCDFRRPAVGTLLGAAETTRGLRQLGEPYDERVADLVVPTALEYVSLVPSGGPSMAPAWFLAHSRAIVEQADELADVVLFDTGPMMLTNEATSLIPATDTVLLVARSGKLSQDQARGALERLTRIGASVAGVAMIGTDGHRRYGDYQPTGETQRSGGADERYPSQFPGPSPTARESGTLRP